MVGNCWRRIFPYEPSCPSFGLLVCWSVVRSVCPNFLKRQGSLTFKAAAEHLFIKLYHKSQLKLWLQGREEGILLSLREKNIIFMEHPVTVIIFFMCLILESRQLPLSPSSMISCPLMFGLIHLFRKCFRNTPKKASQPSISSCHF